MEEYEARVILEVNKVEMDMCDPRSCAAVVTALGLAAESISNVSDVMGEINESIYPS